MPRPRPEDREAERVQQVVGRLEPADHAELDLQDAADVLAAQGADAVVGRRPGVEARLQLPFLVRRQRALAAAAGAVAEAVEPAFVVAADPGVDRASGELDLGGEFRERLAFEDAEDGLESADDLGVGFGADESPEFGGGMMADDLHGGLLPEGGS